MTDHPALARLRELARDLPEVDERQSGAHLTFVVAGVPFAQFRNGDGHGRTVVCVRTSTSDEQDMRAAGTHSGAADPDAAGWIGIDVSADPDWQLIEDRVAHGWELAAPARLLEAGGR